MSQEPVDGMQTTPKKASSPVPMSVEWKATIEKLLKSKDYDRAAMQNDGISIEGLSKDDLLLLISTMPFEFRLPAICLYRVGFMIFAKIPFQPGQLSPEGKLVQQPIATGKPRPITCPEPQGGEEKFVIAWKEGSTWNWRLPTPQTGDSPHGHEDPGYLSIFKEMTQVRNPNNEELDPQKQKEFLEEFFLNTLSMVWDFRDSIAGKRLFYSFDLNDLEDLLHSVQENSYSDPDNSYLAFYAGYLCAREIYFPRCAELSSKEDIESHNGWTSIISHALQRHGIKTERKLLLEQLGCLNIDLYRKDSSETLKFSWPYTPEINGSKFDDSYKRAVRDLKKSARNSKNYLGVDAAKLKKQRESRKARKKSNDENAKLVADAIRKRKESDFKKSFE